MTTTSSSERDTTTKKKFLPKSVRNSQKLDPSTFVNQTPFRTVERRYKSKNQLLDLSDVIDISLLNDANWKKTSGKEIEWTKIVRKVVLGRQVGQAVLNRLDSIIPREKDWEDFLNAEIGLFGYQFDGFPGLTYIPNPFPPSFHRYVIKRCLRDYTLPPNTSNLTTHYDLPPDGLWTVYENWWNLNRERAQNGLEPLSEQLIPLKKRTETNNSYYGNDDADHSESNSGNGGVVPEENQKRHIGINVNCQENGSEKSRSALSGSSVSSSIQTSTTKSSETQSSAGTSGGPVQSNHHMKCLPPSILLARLRWHTLGYQYNWSNKTYFTHQMYPFPDDLNLLIKAIADSTANMYNDKNENVGTKYSGDEYSSQAGVVNYYQLKDALMAHVDRSEENMAAPLVSMRYLSDHHIRH
ncbi:hypothetical protein BKA69DRAFT_1035405 [Paraphysoderma sedebokerense]|nr:hypothetical protein BKA69DRAFT_1035405 [Paraphysoderma sedebokerense]